jgi:urease accessory protein
MPQVSAQPRAEGTASLVVGEGSRIVDLRQQGALKLVFPHHAAGRACEAVMLNTAGGITGGDRFTIGASVDRGQLVMTTQAAERAYRAKEGAGQVTTHLTVGPEGRLHWLPQETILFDGSALKRRLDADLHGDAAALFVETVLFGRLAMGETSPEVDYREDWRIRRDGRLIYADALRISGDSGTLLAPAAVANGARAVASVVYAAPDAEALADRARDLLPEYAGLSLISHDLLAVRMVAADGFDLRAGLVPLLKTLARAELPKCWML